MKTTTHFCQEEIQPVTARRQSKLFKATARLLPSLLLALIIPAQLQAAGPAPVNLLSNTNFAILSGAGITTTGGGVINGNVGASPIAGSAVGVTCAQVNGTIYVTSSGGPTLSCQVVDAGLLTQAQSDLTTAYIYARDLTPVPTGPNLNPGAAFTSGYDIGGLTLPPGLYKFGAGKTAFINTDVTLNGGPNDVWIFQCAVDLEVAVSAHVILTGGAQPNNIFWQVGTSATLFSSSVFQGTIMADQSITMGTSSTIVGRALASVAGVVYNGTGLAVPAPIIGVQQPLGTNLVSGVGSNNFDSVIVGTNASLTFTITNSGTANLTGLGITIDGPDAASFSVTTNPVAPVNPSSNTTFTVRFAPNSLGQKTAALHIASNATTNNPFNLALVGTGVAPIIGVQQPLGTNLTNGVDTNFGSVALGTNASLTFTITNSGSADLTGLIITIDGSNSVLFTVTTNPVAPVSPGSNTTFTVRFAPVSAGVKNAMLHIANNDTNNNPFNIALSGTGIGASLVPGIVVQQPAGTNLVSNVSTNNFGSVSIVTNLNHTFIITNIGTTNLTGLVITIDGTDAAMFTVTTNPVAPLAPGSKTTFTVRFAPVSTGVKTAALHIANNDPNNNPFTIALTGTGAPAPAPVIGVQQPLGTNLTNGVGTNDFGSVSLGTNTSHTFTITNLGNANLTGLVVTIDGTDVAMFSVTTNPAASVNPGSNTTFTVRFSPASLGVKTAALHIANNDTNNNPFNIALTGTGVAAPAPIIGVQQPLGTNLTNGVGTNDFGSISIGTNTSHTFTITNLGNANLTGLVVTIDGTNAAMFSVTTNPTASVNPGSNTTFTVSFSPASLGVKIAALHIANNDTNNNPFNIALTGTGTNGVIILSTNLVIIATTPVVSNPQTGLFEQTVLVTNTSSTTIAGVQMFILNLPVDVLVYNASGSTNGIPYVQYNLPLAPGATVSFLIEYYRANRSPNFQPAFLVQEILPVTVTATGSVLAINSTNLINGRFLIEFTATPGRTYAVQYSSNLLNWVTATPNIVAPANRVQWYDDGPPKTESLPSSVGSRFYQVIELP